MVVAKATLMADVDETGALEKGLKCQFTIHEAFKARLYIRQKKLGSAMVVDDGGVCVGSSKCNSYHQTFLCEIAKCYSHGTTQAVRHCAFQRLIRKVYILTIKVQRSVS